MFHSTIHPSVSLQLEWLVREWYPLNELGVVPDEVRAVFQRHGRGRRTLAWGKIFWVCEPTCITLNNTHCLADGSK